MTTGPLSGLGGDRFNFRTDVVSDPDDSKRDDPMKGKSLIEVTHHRSGSPFAEAFGLERANLDLVDPESMALVLCALNTNLTKEQVETGVEGIKLNAFVKAELLKKIDAQIAEARKKADEARIAAEEKKVLDWCMAGLALLGAIGLTAVTAGLGAGAAAVLFVGVVGVGLASLEVANEVVKEQGVEVTDLNGVTKKLELNLRGMVDAIVADQIYRGSIVMVTKNTEGNLVDKNSNVIHNPQKGKHMTAAELKDYKDDWVLAANLIVVASIIAAGGIGSLVNAGKGAATVGKTAQSMASVERAGHAANIGAAAGAGATQVYSAELSRKIAVIDEAAATAVAKKKMFEAVVKALAAQGELTQDGLKQMMARFAENLEALSSMVAAANTNHEKIARII